MQGLSLAPELLVQCDEKNNGCGGGRLDDAWGFLKRQGIPKDGAKRLGLDIWCKYDVNMMYIWIMYG